MNIETRADRLINLDNETLGIELNNIHAADLAEIFSHVDGENRCRFFELLDNENAADLIEQIPPQMQIELLGAIDQKRAYEIIKHMPGDIIADILADMSDEETEAYLSKLPLRASHKIRELLQYEEDTAGGIMTSDILTVEPETTVEDALSLVRIKAETDTIEFYYLYVVDEKEHLLGVVSWRKLITSQPQTKIESIMEADIINVNIDDNKEKVAEKLIKYSFLGVPVVDYFGKLKGVVTWDDAQTVAKEEATEDIYATSGISTDFIGEDEILSGSINKAIKARIPWLFITLLGEMVAVNVANYFDKTLTALPIIAIFMPLLAGLGGNIGTQSITLMVRGLSTGQVTISSAFHHIFREMKVGIVIGFAFGLASAIITSGWKSNYALGAVVGIAMMINMTLATILGTMTPFVLKRFNIDPAVASGPFIATTIDVLGLAVYFSMTTAALSFLV